MSCKKPHKWLSIFHSGWKKLNEPLLFTEDMIQDNVMTKVLRNQNANNTEFNLKKKPLTHILHVKKIVGAQHTRLSFYSHL